jgi:hypothetical protein
MKIEQAYFELFFENAFLRAKGDAFQDLFERLMGLAYKADFMACRPWGNRGDRKNDGFLKSEKCLFQVYAPNEMTEAKAIAKIQEDFEEAKTYWGKLFEKWVFAHNAESGLPPHVHKLLLDFEDQNPGISLKPWSLVEFKTIFRKLAIEDIQSWFGFAPTEETKTKLGFKDLQVVLETIAGRAVPVDIPVKAVPKGKIEANALSESVAALLKNGMTKAPLVEAFFDQWHDFTLGDRIAKSFRTAYESFREKYPPNQVFAELQTWAGGGTRGAPEHELAVLTVIAYYFERCDIFEEPRSNQP